MMIQRKFILLAYSLLGIGETLALLVNDMSVHKIIKPLLMPVLMLYYFIEVKRQGNAVSRWIVAALSFSWLGDVSLLLQDKAVLYFQLGLAAFLVAHICYVKVYQKTGAKRAALGWVRQVLLMVPFIILAVGLLFVIQEKLHALKVPVTIYIIVILCMVWFALRRYGKTSIQSFWLVLAGAGVFVVSDACIALSRFWADLHFFSPTIMVTYIIAQFLIIKGLLAHQESVLG